MLSSHRPSINEIICKTSTYDKVELKDIRLKKHKMYGYCLDITYRVDRLEDIVDINVPCVRLPISYDEFTLKSELFPYCTVTTADFGLGELEVITEVGEPAYKITTVKTKTKEMTLEEIEKKLGHKVKIVSDKK